MERVALLSEALVVTADILGLPGFSPAAPRQTGRGEERVSLEDAVRDHLLEVLGQTHWNISRAAALLGISRNTLRSRIEKHGLRPAAPAASPRGRAVRPATAAGRVPEVAQGAVPSPTTVRWEPRRLTLLRAALGGPHQADSPLSTSRALEVVVEKGQSFGGRGGGGEGGGGGGGGGGAAGWGAPWAREPVEDAPRRAAHAAMAIHNAAE